MRLLGSQRVCAARHTDGHAHGWCGDRGPRRPTRSLLLRRSPVVAHPLRQLRPAQPTNAAASGGPVAGTMVDVHTGDVPSLVAVGRAAVQLVVVALVIGWIFTHPVALVPYLTVTLVGPAFARY